MDETSVFNYCCIDGSVTTSGIFNNSQLDCLAQWGYDIVINLLPDDSEYAIADEHQRVRAIGLEYTAIPVDFGAPSAADYQDFVEAMSRSNGQRRWIHCAANYRVSAFIARYNMQSKIWSKEQASTHMAKLWNIEDHPVWQNFVYS